MISPVPDTDLELGLTIEDAAARLLEWGPNELPPPRRPSLASRVFAQLFNPMALLLIAAAAVSWIGLSEAENAMAIIAIVVLNAVIGLVQEGRAANALEALRSVQSPTSRIRRGGRTRDVPARDLVPGDIAILAAGDRVAADMRVLESSFLEVDEAILTGESLPVLKNAHADDEGDLLFSGTLVTRGTGHAIVLATGPGTRLGGIAAQLNRPEPPTPLQSELGRLTARLGSIAVVIAAAVFGLILVRSGFTPDGLQRSFLAAVALAVAAVPEGLATVVTVALALGVRRMAAEGAIIRRLPAVETLGSTTVLLTDKTGTLTENRMALGGVSLAGGPPIALVDIADPTRRSIEEVMVLCNDASLDPPSGDPLEVALLEAVGASTTEALRNASRRVGAVPFDSDRRLMTVLVGAGNTTLLLVKGAPEEVLPACASTLTPDGTSAGLDRARIEQILTAVDDMASSGMRILGLARRELDSPVSDLISEEKHMTLVGLAVLRDPVRPEAARSVKEARAAGVDIVMVTGDHSGTAVAVAEEVGLAGPGPTVRTGRDLRDGNQADHLLTTRVYARVEPEQKLSLVEALQAQGHVVAVTGDGVNDAPALRRANIGVAMGRSGSDVAREAADMVVVDDNLATIITAIREGRGIYDNIRKVVDYLVGGNLSEIMVVVASLALFPALGIPLLPIQLLWINLLTDGLPALALGVDPVDPSLMRRMPRPSGEGLLTRARVALLMGRASLIAGASVGSLAVSRFVLNEPWDHARAVMFTVLVIAHLLYAFVVRGRAVAANRWLVLAVATGLALQAAVIIWPSARPIFGTASLAPEEILLAACAGTAPVALMLLSDRRKEGR